MAEAERCNVGPQLGPWGRGGPLGHRASRSLPGSVSLQMPGPRIHRPPKKGRGVGGTFKRKTLDSTGVRVLADQLECKRDVTFLHPKFKMGFLPVLRTASPAFV